MCDFDSKDLCNWQNMADSNTNWKLWEGSTLMSNTGPPYDHTQVSWTHTPHSALVTAQRSCETHSY